MNRPQDFEGLHLPSSPSILISEARLARKVRENVGASLLAVSTFCNGSTYGYSVVTYPGSFVQAITPPARTGGYCQPKDKLLFPEQLLQATSCRTREFQ